MKARNILLSLGLLGALIAPAAARADDDTRSEPTDPYEPVTMEEHDEHLRTPMGMELTIGGGVADFTDNTVQNTTDTAGIWTARVLLGSRSFIGLEGGYIGAASSLDGLGVDSSTVLTANGAEALLRLNLWNGPVQPYVFGGGAWKHYALANNDFSTASVEESDDVFETPFGGGLAFRGNGFVFDTRFDYRLAFDEELFTTIGGDLDNWNVSGRVGFEF